MSASNGTKAEYTSVIRVHDTTHIAVTTTRQGNRRSRTTPHKDRMRGLVKHRDHPPNSYIVNERYNSRNKWASQDSEKNSKWQEPETNNNKIILIKRCSLTRVKLTALYKHLITKTTLTYISANKTLIIVA